MVPMKRLVYLKQASVDTKVFPISTAYISKQRPWSLLPKKLCNIGPWCVSGTAEMVCYLLIYLNRKDTFLNDADSPIKSIFRL